MLRCALGCRRAASRRDCEVCSADAVGELPAGDRERVLVERVVTAVEVPLAVLIDLERVFAHAQLVVLRRLERQKAAVYVEALVAAAVVDPPLLVVAVVQIQLVPGADDVVESDPVVPAAELRNLHADRLSDGVVILARVLPTDHLPDARRVQVVTHVEEVPLVVDLHQALLNVEVVVLLRRSSDAQPSEHAQQAEKRPKQRPS